MIDGDRLTVIDFDDCGYSWYLYDFASACRSWSTSTMRRRWRRNGSRVRAGPADHPQDEQVACSLSMIRRLQMLGGHTHRQDALPPALWARRSTGPSRRREVPAITDWLID